MKLGQRCGTDPFTCGIWCSLWGGGIRIELNCRAPVSVHWELENCVVVLKNTHGKRERASLAQDTAFSSTWPVQWIELHSKDKAASVVAPAGFPVSEGSCQYLKVLPVPQREQNPPSFLDFQVLLPYTGKYHAWRHTKDHTTTHAQVYILGTWLSPTVPLHTGSWCLWDRQQARWAWAQVDRRGLSGGAG